MRLLVSRAVLRTISCLALLGMLSTPAWAATYDVTGCKGGVWSYRIWGTADRWAFLPDASAVYWRTKIPFLGDQTSAYFRLRGAVPAARYYSVTTYDSGRNVVDSIADDEIVLTGGEFIVKLRDLAPGHDDPSPNVIRTAYDLAGTEVIFRLYLPEGLPAGWAPPKVEYVVSGSPAGLPRNRTQACNRFNATYLKANRTKSTQLLASIAAWTAESAAIATAPREPDACYLPSVEGTYEASFPVADSAPVPWACNAPAFYQTFLAGYPNAHNAYLWANLDPFDSAGELTVLRFRLPDLATQLRYLSICVHQGEQSAGWLLSCLTDSDLREDSDAPGWATVVLSAGAPPSNVGEANWLPYQTDAPLVLMRYLRPKPDFVEAPHTWDPAAGSLAEHMGDYYPTAVYCPQGVFELGYRCGL